MNTIELSLIISLASLGIRAVTDKGMIFYFLRKPFDSFQLIVDSRPSKQYILEEINRLKNDIEEMELLPDDWKCQYHYEPGNEKFYSKEERIQQWNDKLFTEQKKLFRQQFDWIYRFILYLMKPVFMCSTCMASLHTLIWFPIITGELFTYKLILVMLSVAFFNTIGWLLVLLLRNHLK